MDEKQVASPVRQRLRSCLGLVEVRFDLVHRFGRTLVQAHREWLDQVERELGGPDEERR